MIVIFFMVLGFCMIIGLSLSTPSSRVAMFSNPLNILIMLGVIPAVLAVVGLGYLISKRLSNKLFDPEFKAIKGVSELNQDYSSNSGITSYYVYVEKIRFAFPEDVTSIFNERVGFRIYCCETGYLKFVLSYEEIR